MQTLYKADGTPVELLESADINTHMKIIENEEKEEFIVKIQKFVDKRRIILVAGNCNQNSVLGVLIINSNQDNTTDLIKVAGADNYFALIDQSVDNDKKILKFKSQFWSTISFISLDGYSVFL